MDQSLQSKSELKPQREYHTDNSKNRGRSHSKSKNSRKNLECYYCKKKVHLKKKCLKWKFEKGKEKDKDLKRSTTSSVKIEEVNSVEVIEVGDILLTSKLKQALLKTSDGYDASNKIIDFGVSFHVTPHRQLV